MVQENQHSWRFLFFSGESTSISGCPETVTHQPHGGITEAAWGLNLFARYYSLPGNLTAIVPGTDLRGSEEYRPGFISCFKVNYSQFIPDRYVFNLPVKLSS